MTNEEAINEIKDASDREVRYGDTKNHYDEVMKRIDAFDMAIKALKVMQGIEDAYMSELLKTPTELNVPISDPYDGCQYELNSTNGNPCYSCGKYKLTEKQPCEDCISRQAVIKHICESKECYKDECKGRLYKRCFDLQWIYDLPSVTPQPKIGHWEYVQYDSNPNIGNWHCSECRGICTEMHSIEDAYNYCPNCGAKMEVEE